MVSLLWKACADGDAAAVDALLKDATSVDIEVKDHTGVTPLIQAVKAGHVDIVKALVARGVDPTNASAQGRPETYTQDPHILQILATARGEPSVPYPDPSQYYPYPQYPPYPLYPDPSVQYYPPPPPPPQQPQAPQEGEHAANLPPPEVARNIPCRYYPACRYGSFCIFAHPQVPYFPGHLPPPAHYGPPPANPPPPPLQPFDANMGAPAPYPYYPLSPQFNPVSPGHMRTHSEMLSPPPFSPSHPPMQMQYLPGPPPPGPPMSPVSAYPAPPPLNAYPRRGSVTSVASYPSPATLDPTHGAPVPKLSDTQGSTRSRRSSAAVRDNRPPYTGRKPPCLFFPSGRCRNGDDCRFPHVMPEGNTSPPPQRGQFPPRSRAGTGYFASRDVGAGAGYGAIDEKLSRLSVRDSLASANDATAAKAPQPNGKRAPAPAPAKQQQRVPSADDFPVLRGATPPQQHANGHANGHAWAQAVNGTGPTAAQLLREKDAVASRDPSPRPAKDVKLVPAPVASPTANGSAVPENLASTSKPSEVQVSA